MHRQSSHIQLKESFSMKGKNNDPVFLPENILLVSDKLMEDHGCGLEIRHISLDLLNH